MLWISTLPGWHKSLTSKHEDLYTISHEKRQGEDFMTWQFLRSVIYTLVTLFWDCPPLFHRLPDHYNSGFRFSSPLKGLEIKPEYVPSESRLFQLLGLYGFPSLPSFFGVLVGQERLVSWTASDRSVFWQSIIGHMRSICCLFFNFFL